MRLSTEQLKGGWLHPRQSVRNAVAAHFAHALTSDPDVTAHAIRGAREFGWERFITWSHWFTGLPLADESALEWVCGEAERADAAAPSEHVRAGLAGMLARADIALLDRHRSRIVALPSLRPADRQVVVSRLELARCPPAECWRRLEDHCRMAVRAEEFDEACIPEAELLLEPLERAGGESVARVMEVLSNPPPQEGAGDDPAEWLAGLMITLAGRLRIEEAAAPIWHLLGFDWDWYTDEAIGALTRIGSPGVARLIRDRSPLAEWETRLAATTVLSNIRGDEVAAAIEALLGAEDEDALRALLGAAAASQFDDRLVPLALEVLAEDPLDPERDEIRDTLVAFSHLSGYHLPDRDEWERSIDERAQRISRFADDLDDADELDDLDDPGDAFDFDDDEGPGLPFVGIDEATEAPIRRGVQVGRNDPCPCGSGKKFKRCCLQNAPG